MKLLTARRPVAAVAIAAAVAAIAGPAVLASPAQAAVTQAYFTANSGGTVQPFTVPPAVTRIFVSAIGGSGGAGASRGSFSGGSGGAAGSVSAALSVTPGQTLNIYIGYAGAAATGNSPGAGGASSYLSVIGPFVYGGNGGT
ncbi:MAG: hypothetical protein JWN96_1927, partial [Mycobacterium sp.]|nr:hypothetical protein [Mycobacterium sp.]